jgi:hypothetical protein
MSEDFFLSVRGSISDQRLDAYRQSHTDTDVDLLGRYLWNTALCEALYPTLQNLEIALRNNIYNATQISFDNCNWLDDPDILVAQQLKSVAKAKREILNSGRNATIGRVIAELTFGFWTSLFDRKYDQIFWNRKTLITIAFPNMPNRIRNRHTLSKRFGEIRKLRNRAFHHEPIWNNNHLQQQHADLIDAINWLNPNLKNTIVVILDRFPLVYNEGSQPYSEQIQEFLR